MSASCWSRELGSVDQVWLRERERTMQTEAVVFLWSLTQSGEDHIGGVGAESVLDFALVEAVIRFRDVGDVENGVEEKLRRERRRFNSAFVEHGSIFGRGW